MSKYSPLDRHLRAAKGKRVIMTFAQIERVLGIRLPSSARTHAAWWSNNEGHVQAQAWRASGYRTEQVDLATEKLVFAAEQASRFEATPSLFGSMKGSTVVMPGVDLTEPAAPEWGVDADG